VIAFYQLGYGIAAFGTGPIQEAGVSLSTLFAATAVVAVGLGAISFAVTSGQSRRHPPSKSLTPEGART
jgi:hypothetical protein